MNWQVKIIGTESCFQGKQLSVSVLDFLLYEWHHTWFLFRMILWKKLDRKNFSERKSTLTCRLLFHLFTEHFNCMSLVIPPVLRDVILLTTPFIAPSGPLAHTQISSSHIQRLIPVGEWNLLCRQTPPPLMKAPGKFERERAYPIYLLNIAWKRERKGAEGTRLGSQGGLTTFRRASVMEAGLLQMLNSTGWTEMIYGHTCAHNLRILLEGWILAATCI